MAVEAARASWSCPALRPHLPSEKPLCSPLPCPSPSSPCVSASCPWRGNTLPPEATQDTGWSTRSLPCRDGARRETQPLQTRRLQTEPAAWGPCPGEAVATPLWAPHCRHPDGMQVPPLWISPLGVSPLQAPHCRNPIMDVSPWAPPLQKPPLPCLPVGGPHCEHLHRGLTPGGGGGAPSPLD